MNLAAYYECEEWNKQNSFSYYRATGNVLVMLTNEIVYKDLHNSGYK